jgi:hypothetical protein
VAQFAAPAGPRSSTSGVLTVAELLKRNAPAPGRILGSETAPPLSVGSLLRREGRAPHALDRPVLPRTSRVEESGEFVDDRPTETIAKRVVVRRGAIAAGTLLAAGSVFGAAVVTDTSLHQQDAAAGTHPGQGILDGTGTAGPTIPGVALSPTAGTGGLDAATGAPVSWIPVAFPSALAGSTDGTTAAKAPSTSGGATGARKPASGSTPSSGTGAGSSSGSNGGKSAAGGSSGGDSANTSLGSTVSGATAAVGETASGLGNSVPGPVGGVVTGVGDTVTGAGKALGNTVDNATAPVTAPLQKATAPVTDTLQKATAPVSSAVNGLLGGLL